MNLLSRETSPYLLQHKDNPVHWHAWNNDALMRAQTENKMILISIGYSACHWCHVMEREVFEDKECAEWMNRHLVCIKVDREERPDIDGVYMNALHLMGQAGGWPLNIFALPDGRPVFGGTYFPKQRWLAVLENLNDLFVSENDRMVEYAVRLQEGLFQLDELIPNQEENVWSSDQLTLWVNQGSKKWDLAQGGTVGAPKFPMPASLEFLLHYGVKLNHAAALDYVHLTLEKMAMGGIYDQIGGGFSRYSVDALWKIPHFEKMLYDNAQLISLYAQAYRHSPKDLYKEVLLQTIDWLERDMLSQDGIFYAAMDADSEGEEGKFYSWTEEQLRQALGEEYEIASYYFSIGKEALWEDGKNVLLRTQSDMDFAIQHGLSIEQLREQKEQWVRQLIKLRSLRIPPALDNKCLLPWNALMVIAYTEVFKALQQDMWLNKAIDLAENMARIFEVDESLYHAHTQGKTHIPAFLDGHVFWAQALLALYEVSREERWLHRSHHWVSVVLSDFEDRNSPLLNFTSKHSQPLISPMKEVQDNVIPASNSSMCAVLFRLSHVLDNKEYRQRSEAMLQQVVPIINHPNAYSNWLKNYLWFGEPFHEVAITGPQCAAIHQQMMTQFLPNCMLVASTMESELPLFKHRFGSNTAIYVCAQNKCNAPVNTIEQVLDIVR